MNAIFRAIPWAAAMLLLAQGEAYGLVERSTAVTMFAVLPGLMVVTMQRQGRCLRRRSKESAL